MQKRKTLQNMTPDDFIQEAINGMLMEQAAGITPDSCNTHDFLYL
jgi:hypothetical protein